MLAQLNTTLSIARYLVSCSLFIFIVVFSTKTLSTDAIEEVTYFGATGKYSFKNDVFLKLLHLSLTKTKPKFGDYTLSQVEVDLKQNRAVEEMSESCPFDLIWLVSDKSREHNLVPVRIPLLKGLFGLRAPMIHTDSMLAFDKILFSEQLQLLTAGQGHDWPDTRILRHNNFKVFPVANFRALFDMLAMKKFDYFPRSVAEITDELKLLNNENLMTDPNILLYYPSPIYFFVCQEKKKLAERIKDGLEQAIEDGSFNDIFESSREYKAFLALGGLKKKRIFNLENSELDLHRLPKNQKYWLVQPSP